MKIIKESELREMIRERVKEELNKPYMYEYWNKLNKYYITEGLTVTYDSKKTVNILRNKYDFKSLGVTLEHLNDNREEIRSNNDRKTTRDSNAWYHIGLYFQFGVKDNADVVYDIIHTCDACGWFLSDCTYFTRNGMEQNINVKNDKSVDFYDEKLKKTPVKLLFRAKFNAEYKPKSVPEFLYHVCPTRVVNKILQQGLTQRNNGRIASHPERVYLFIDYNSSWEEIASQFRISGDDEPYSYLEIDTRKIDNMPKFYYDSNVMRNHPAIYTLEPIPPTTIKVIDSQEK